MSQDLKLGKSGGYLTESNVPVVDVLPCNTSQNFAAERIMPELPTDGGGCQSPPCGGSGHSNDPDGNPIFRNLDLPKINAFSAIAETSTPDKPEMVKVKGVDIPGYDVLIPRGFGG